MARSDPITDEEILRTALRLKARSPEPITVQQLIRMLREEVDAAPSRARVITVVNQNAEDLADWVRIEDTQAASSDLAGLLARWTAAPGSDKASLATHIREAATRPLNGAPIISTAQALGLADGSPDWSVIPFDGIDQPWFPALVDVAARSGVHEWLVDAACWAAVAAAKVAREAVATADAEAISTAVATRLIEWPTRRLDPSDVAGAARRAGRLVKGDLPPAVAEAVIMAIASHTDSSRPTVWVDAYLHYLAAEPPDHLGEMLEALDRVQLQNLVQVVRWCPLEPGSPRSRLLAALWTVSPDLASSDVAWHQATVDGIGWVLSSLADADGVISRIADTVVEPVVANATRSMRTADLFSLAASWPVLARFVDVAVVVRSADRESAPAQLLRKAMAQTAAAAETRAELLAVDLDKAATELAETRRSYEITSAQLEDTRREVERLEKRLQLQAATQQDAFEAQLRQARIDALKVIIDIAERTRSMMSVVEGLPTLVEELYVDIGRRLESLGVTIVGEVGQIREFDPSLDAMVGERATVVEVLAPAYVARTSNDAVTPLRESVVRGVGH